MRDSIDIHLFLHGTDQSGILHQLADIKTTLGELKMTDAEAKVLLDKIDASTNATAANLAQVAIVDQKISDEIDAFLAAVPVGTALSQENADHLAALATSAQSTADASTAAVTTLQAIAAKGQPVVPPPAPPIEVIPVPPPPPPVG